MVGVKITINHFHVLLAEIKLQKHVALMGTRANHLFAEL